MLSEESMKKRKHQRHLTTNHVGCANKPIEFYERELQSIKSQMTAFTGVNKSTVYSSYVASYHIAKKKITSHDWPKVVNGSSEERWTNSK